LTSDLDIDRTASVLIRCRQFNPDSTVEILSLNVLAGM